MAVPNGWVESPVPGDPKVYYQAKIGNYIGTNGQSIEIFARTDTAGNYQLYQTTATSLLGGLGNPIYTYNQSGTSSKGRPGLLTANDFEIINGSVKKRSLEINQAVGTPGEQEALNNSEGYKNFVQTTQPEPDNPQGQSNDDTSGTSGDGSGEPPSNPGGPLDFQSTAEKFSAGDKEKFKTYSLRYPESMNGSQDRIVIVQKRYKSILGEGGTSITNIPTGYNTFSQDRNTGTTDIVGTAVLPMPNDISETNVTAWGEDSLSTLSAMLGTSAAKFGADFAQGKFGEAAGDLYDAFQKITDDPARKAIQQFLTLNAAAKIVGKTGVNFNPEAFRSRVTGTAINPNLELLFQGPKLRSFGFQFKMTPRSREEAQNIRYIIKFFKKGMASKRNESQPFFLGAPNVFDIHFRSGENTDSDFNRDLKSIGNIKTCALQQCVVNYTPDGFYAAFEDSQAGGSQPISVTIQLAFTELTPLYSDNYNTEKDNVGWEFDSLNINYKETN